MANECQGSKNTYLDINRHEILKFSCWVFSSFPPKFVYQLSFFPVIYKLQFKRLNVKKANKFLSSSSIPNSQQCV